MMNTDSFSLVMNFMDTYFPKIDGRKVRTLYGNYEGFKTYIKDEGYPYKLIYTCENIQVYLVRDYVCVVGKGLELYAGREPYMMRGYNGSGKNLSNEELSKVTEALIKNNTVQKKVISIK